MVSSKTTIVSVGGSLIVPDHIDTDFLSRLKQLLLRRIKTGDRFVIIAGGGKTSRRYQDAANKVTALGNHDIDWLGIHATRLNAHLLRSVFVDIAHPVIIESPLKIKSDAENADEPVIVAAGWKPGWSTDYVATCIAEQIGAKTLVNLSNIDYVYDKDPRAFADAKPIRESNWPAFRKLLPENWDPGLSSPFDPVAARKAEALQLEVAIVNGRHLDELEKYLAGLDFIGTLIH
jgi:uridylate kinase